MNKQRESRLLLLLKWNDPKQRGAYSAKSFEYLAVRRPILAISGYEDVVDELLNETDAVVSSSTLEEIKGFLEKSIASTRLREECHTKATEPGLTTTAKGRWQRDLLRYWILSPTRLLWLDSLQQSTWRSLSQNKLLFKKRGESVTAPGCFSRN